MGEEYSRKAFEGLYVESWRLQVGKLLVEVYNRCKGNIMP
jgi:hypothetical protein